jgi:hypothetical protein
MSIVEAVKPGIVRAIVPEIGDVQIVVVVRFARH